MIEARGVHREMLWLFDRVFGNRIREGAVNAGWWSGAILRVKKLELRGICTTGRYLSLGDGN